MVVALIGYRLKELERSGANGIYKRLDIARLFVFIRFNIYIYKRTENAREKKKKEENDVEAIKGKNNGMVVVSMFCR